MEEKRDKTKIKTGSEKKPKMPRYFCLLSVPEAGYHLFSFMTKTQTAKSPHFSILRMCLFRHVKTSLLRI